MAERSFAAINHLMRAAEAAATEQMDLPGAISQIIRSGVDNGAEPYLMLGVLIEGITHIIAGSIPAEARADTTKAVAKMLQDRLAANNLTG